MWEWLTRNADALTAAVAVLGLLVASALAWEAIRVARRTARNERGERLAKYFSDVKDLVIEYQHPALMPYWQAPADAPVDPTSSDAKDLHRATKRAISALEMARFLEFRVLDAEFAVVEATMWPLYFFAQTPSPVEVANQLSGKSKGQGQTFEGAWADTEKSLRGYLETARESGSDIGVSAVLAEMKQYVHSRYSEEPVGRMQLADAALDRALEQLELAFRDHLPRLASSMPGTVK